MGTSAVRPLEAARPRPRGQAASEAGMLHTHLLHTHLLTQKGVLIASLQAKQAGVHAAIEQAKSAQDSLAALRAQNAELTQ